MSPPAIDRVIDGRYRVEVHLAEGGMASVYRATDLRLDRPVALKVMRPDLARDADFVSRFRREAQAAARLSHPHVVSVFDQGEDDDVVFLAMELVEGDTLRDVVATQAPLSVRRATEIVDEILQALSAAHRAGIAHRDIKPENVLMSATGTVKVADFGLARAITAGSMSRTSDLLWGTAAYLSPEQVEHGRSDERTDVYAVGLLLYELLTGVKAFPGQSPIQVA
ncbi:MAG: serine/threonine protein kinase, partial [Actinobacteria bacterium]|nr:serine/threonine protein kinase [Actinomycetota bacterium]